MVENEREWVSQRNAVKLASRAKLLTTRKLAAAPSRCRSPSDCCQPKRTMAYRMPRFEERFSNGDLLPSKSVSIREHLHLRSSAIGKHLQWSSPMEFSTGAPRRSRYSRIVRFFLPSPFINHTHLVQTVDPAASAKRRTRCLRLHRNAILCKHSILSAFILNSRPKQYGND